MKYSLIFIMLSIFLYSCSAQTMFKDEQAVVVNGASGFKIDSFVVTANHVAPFDNIAYVIESNGNLRLGSVVARDTVNDIALIRTIKDTFFSYSTSISTASQRVHTIASPARMWFSKITGEVRFVDRVYEYKNNNNKYIQIGIDSYSGSSGAPVFDDKGNLIGMITMMIPGTRFTLCIPIEKIVELIQKQKS